MKNLKIVNLYWDRIYLNFEFLCDDKKVKNFAFVSKDYKKVVPFTVSKEDNLYKAKINIANVGNRKMLDMGKWYIAGSYTDNFDEENAIIFVVDPKLGYKLDNLSNVYRYGGMNYAYIITFSLDAIDDDVESLNLLMSISYMMRNKKPLKRRPMLESNTIKGYFKNLGQVIVKKLMNATYFIMSRIYPKKGNRILIMSENRSQLMGNLEALDKRIKERNLNFKIDYSFRKAVGNHTTIFSWAKVVFKMAKADYIFLDDFTPILAFIDINPKTTVTQTWHAGAGFKSVGYARFGKNGSPFPTVSCHRKYDYGLTGSESLIEVYEEVWGIDGEDIIPSGLPRLDGYLDEDRIKQFKKDFFKEYPELKNKKIILFAPTYRGRGQKTAYYDYSKLDFERLYNFCGDEYAILFKMHPFIKEQVPIEDKYKDRFYNFYDYKNINDLFYITDLLITDYSSNFYEYSLMKRPVIFYTYDKEFYEIVRGVHRSIDSSAPGKVCNNFEELMDALKNKDFEQEKIFKFVEENFTNTNNNASDIIIDKVLLKK